MKRSERRNRENYDREVLELKLMSHVREFNLLCQTCVLCQRCRSFMWLKPPPPPGPPACALNAEWTSAARSPRSSDIRDRADLSQRKRKR